MTAKAAKAKEKNTDGRLPVIRVGMWVRMANTPEVPPQFVGRDGVVVSAVVLRSQGGDAFSGAPY